MRKLARRDFMAGITATCGMLASPALGARHTEAGGTAFGTYWRVLSSARSMDVTALTTSLIEEVDLALSPYRADSELAAFNISRTSEPWHLGPVSAHVTGAALRFARATGGVFDPTVGPTVSRLGFGPIKGTENANWRALRLSGRNLTKVRPDVTLDLCGIAKGYAIDTLATRLDAAGLDDWLIDFGGEIRSRGRYSGGRAWRVAVTRPFAPDGQTLVALKLVNEAVATSGPGEQSYIVGDRRIGHLIDPATGAPADHGLASVSVIASKAMHADALATALAVMGPARGADWAHRHGLTAMFCQDGPRGSAQVHMTGGFEKRLLG